MHIMIADTYSIVVGVGCLLGIAQCLGLVAEVDVIICANDGM